MNPTWEGAPEPDLGRPTPIGWLLVLMRLPALVVVVFGGLLLLILFRLVERPLCSINRPVTPTITVLVCRIALRIIGIKVQVSGQPMNDRGAVVANHSSWLDIFVLNASQRIYFVSKSEVAGWPGIGWLARATGTLFIERNRARAREHAHLFEDRLLARQKLLFFPEGTSTDGLRVLDFKTTLFAAFFTDEMKRVVSIQPVAVRYLAPVGADARIYGWWGNMSFGPHLLSLLARSRHGAVRVQYLEPLKVDAFADRKSLAKRCEELVRESHAELAGAAEVRAAPLVRQ